jgi:hypothetical protein
VTGEARAAALDPPFGAADSDCLDVGSSTQNRPICVPVKLGETAADFTVVHVMPVIFLVIWSSLDGLDQR